MMGQKEVTIIPLNNIVFFPNTSLYLHLDEKYLINLILSAIENEKLVGFSYGHDRATFNDLLKKPPMIFTLGSAYLIEQRDDGSC